MITEKEMLEELNRNIAIVEERERKKSRPLRVITGLAICILLIFLSIITITTVFAGIFQKEMTLSSLGGEVYARNCYIFKNQEIFNNTHLTERKPLKLLYKAEHREKVQLIEKKQFDKTVIHRQYLVKVKTASGIQGWTGSVHKKTEPHFDYQSRFKESITKTPFIKFDSFSLFPRMINPEYKHFLVYTIHLFLKADHRYFWLLFLVLLSIVTTVSFLMVRNIKNDSKNMYNPSLVISRTAMILGIITGIISVFFKQNATVYLSSGLEILKYPSWTSAISSPVILWLFLYLSFIILFFFIALARPFDLINTLVFPVLFIVSLTIGNMVSAAFITGAGMALGTVAGWIAGSIEIIILILFIIGLFSPSSTSLQTRMTKATGSIKDDSGQRMKDFYAEQQRKRNSGRYKETAFGLMEKKDGE